MKELSLYKATAMTSPQAGKSDIVAPLATTSIDDNLPTGELTAEPHAEEAISEGEQQQPSESIAQNDGEEVVAIKEGSAEEQKTEITGAAGQNMVEQFIASHYPQENMTAGIANTGPEGGFGGGLDLLASFADPMHPFYNPFTSTGYPPVTVDGLPMMPANMDAHIDAQQSYLDPSPYIHEPQETRISAYARLEFEDGHFYMNTYSVILGRDLAAHRAAVRRDEEEKQRQLAEADPKTPVRIKEESRYTKSVISESGGILREGDDSDPEERAARKRRPKRPSKASKASKRSKSTGSSSHHQSRRNSEAQPTNGAVEYQPQSQVRRSGPETVGATPVDPASLRPSPYECPLIGIHPPADAPAANYKNISRKHVKIKFNQKKHMWEAHFMGRNGGFIDDEFHPCQSVISLTSGATMQIGGVIVRFVLPDVAIGETGAEERGEPDSTGAERYMEGGKEMSYEFEDPHGNGNLEETSEEESEDVGHEEEEQENDEEGEGSDGQENGDNEEIEGNGDEEEEERALRSDQSPQGDEQEEVVTNALNQPQMSPKSEKKRGPGRPPKDGVMSKREQKLVKKQVELAAQSQSQQKASKKTAPPAPGAPAPVKNKVGRPRKHPRPDTPPLPREKRKYTKRKPKEPKDGEVKQEGSGEDPAKEKKDKKPPKPPRSPSPQFREEDLTPEQLAKPNANYVTLIHEALTNSPTGQMSLPQIYRAIQRKYPYFVVKCGTNGWQSSVRHNLSQHHAFRKVERDGKGWMWAIVEGVSIEKEKKRRPSPPPQLPPGHMQAIYPGNPHMMQGHPYGPGIMGPPPPGYHPAPPHHIQPGQAAAYMGQPMHINGHVHPQGVHPPVNGIPPPGFAAAIPAQLNAPNNPQFYSSPYASKPPPSNGAQPNEQRPPTDEKPHSPHQPSAANSEPIQPSLSIAQPLQPEQTQQPQSQTQTQQRSQATQPLQPPQAVQAPQTQKPQQSSTASLPGPPNHNDVVMRAVETFKMTLVPSMKAKTANAEEVVNSAVNRVLGFATESTVPGDPHEDVLMSTLASMLSKIAGSNFSATPNQHNDHRSPPPQAQTNHNGPQAGAPQPSVKPTGEKPTVMRPSFTGQGQTRSNGTSVSRPPMTTPGMNRTNSSGSANASNRPTAPSASPAPAAAQGSPNGANTPNMPPNEPVQVIGQKRPLDGPDNMREFKKMTTSGPPQLKT